MKRLLLQLAVVVLAAGSQAQAAPEDPMAGFYGNTVTIAVPDAYYFTKRYIDPDGTWREPRGDDWVRGLWRIENGRVCSWQTEPAVRDPRRYCYAPVARKVGDRWTSTDPDTGNLVVQTLEPGRD